jgi:hypothetical protein
VHKMPNARVVADVGAGIDHCSWMYKGGSHESNLT